MSKTRVGQRLRTQVLVDAGGHCGYCRVSEEITGAQLEIEHIVPEGRCGPTRRANLWAVCRYCNLLKSDRVEATDPETGALAPLFNPREQGWSEHFAWIDGGLRISGTTPAGRAPVEALALNRAMFVRARGYWVSAGWHPPREPGA
ncbi:MAG TPA: HNH endonuclease signature motif containing protein [Chloroflexota bacterium]|nr:HNH endonuclease signature motif containing protein [Chloroflexota bacterium]